MFHYATWANLFPGFWLAVGLGVGSEINKYISLHCFACLSSEPVLSYSPTAKLNARLELPCKGNPVWIFVGFTYVFDCLTRLYICLFCAIQFHLFLGLVLRFSGVGPSSLRRSLRTVASSTPCVLVCFLGSSPTHSFHDSWKFYIFLGKREKPIIYVHYELFKFFMSWGVLLVPVDIRYCNICRIERWWTSCCGWVNCNE